jgi:uncharacterized protein (TIGR02118 family)
MWKVLTVLKRKPELTRDEFIAYWRDVHAPLMEKQEDFWRHVRKYVQNYALDEVETNTYDGVSELYFDSAPELKAALEEPGFATVQEDASNFVDLGASKSWVAEFKPVKHGGPIGMKVIAAGHRREGLTREEAQDHWGNKHPQHCAREAPEFWSFIKRYHQNHTRRMEGLPLQTLTDEYDFCAESCYDSLEAMETSRRPEYQYLELVHPDEVQFSSGQNSLRVLSRESVIYDSTT